MSFPGALLLTIYYLVLGVLAFYGLHRLALVMVYLRTRRRIPPRPADPPEWPVVTVQLPLYNEMYVAQRLIEAVCRLDYPRDRLEIQVLDDSTDETTGIVARVVEEQRRLGIDIHHLHRTDRRGFKAGALAAGLERARGELIAIFDADFVPQPEFLRQAVPHFSDPGLGMVQGSWAHINRGYSLLTRAQAILLDGHFLIEHTARNRGGCFFNFNGTAGVWRREAILLPGGWQHDTLTEDLDLSYRAQLAGWKFLYLPDLAVPSELPVDINGFKGQQYRWTKGSVQTGRKLLGRILRAPLPWKVKFEAFVHLTNNTSYALMVVMALLIFPAMVIRADSTWWDMLVIDLPLFLTATVSVLIFYMASQSAAGLGWRTQVRYLPAVMGLGIGLSVNNARAVLSGLFQRGGTFHRTPKYRIEHQGEDWLQKRYRSGRNVSLWIELTMALYFLSCFIYAVVHEMWISLPFLFLFVQGYSYMTVLTLLPVLRDLKARTNAPISRKTARAPD
ncbi:MAG TPA: cellulose synthase family protein [Thermoanaerobaculia bacterium]|nr:cellulose synthase family protein [Thermoanaerobaculia bacterium]